MLKMQICVTRPQCVNNDLEVDLTNTSQKRKKHKKDETDGRRNTRTKDCYLLDPPPSIMEVGFSETSVTPPRPNDVTYRTTGVLIVRAVGTSAITIQCERYILKNRKTGR